MIGWSRVAKGRHYPLDCACGWVVGHASGVRSSRAVRGARCAGKIVGGVALTAEWGGYYFVPLCRRLAPRALAPRLRSASARRSRSTSSTRGCSAPPPSTGPGRACFDDAWECRESPGVSGAARRLAGCS